MIHKNIVDTIVMYIPIVVREKSWRFLEERVQKTSNRMINLIYIYIYTGEISIIGRLEYSRREYSREFSCSNRCTILLVRG